MNTGQDPNASASGSQDEKKYSETELNERVSALLGAKLGPIPVETLEVFKKDPRFLNKMLVTQTLIDADPELRKKVDAIMTATPGENRVQIPEVDFDRIFAEAQAESGIELDDKTKKVLGAFTKKLGVVMTGEARKAGAEGGAVAAPGAVRQMTRDDQWTWVRGQEDYQKDKLIMRTTRDILNEAFAKKEKMTPVEAYELAKKEVAVERGGKQNVGGQTPSVSQPRQNSAQATGLRGVANSEVDSGSTGNTQQSKKSYRQAVAEKIDNASWQTIVDAAQKRFG